MEKNRLFTFGCSHTAYKWPSWADIIGLNYDEFYNFGQAGSGIFFMLYQFTFANEHFKFNENDTLLFMLSDEARIDIMKKRKWLACGLAFNSMHVFGEKFFEHYSEIHAVESSYVNVYFLKEVLDKIGCKYEIFHAFEPFFKNTPELFHFTTIDIWNKMFNLTNKTIMPLTEFGKSLNDKSYYLINNKTKEGYLDGHFKISTHLNYVKTYLSEYYNEIHDEIVKKWESEKIENELDTEVENKFMNLTKKNKLIFENGILKKHFI